jgi:hypothetical protein
MNVVAAARAQGSRGRFRERETLRACQLQYVGNIVICKCGVEDDSGVVMPQRD